MAETKQTRKTPLTTIAISQELADRLDNLLTTQYQGMKRKDFVEGAIAYFERTNYPLNVDQIDYTPLERLANKLEKSAAIIADDSQERVQMSQLFMDMKQKFIDLQQSQLALPSSADITAASEAKAKAETELEATRQELTALRQELDNYGRKIKDQDADMTVLRNKLAVAIAELERCSSGIFTKPSKTTIESLKS